MKIQHASEHYNEEYFKWQDKDGPLGGWINKNFFQKNIEKSAIVIDFGCGGGYLLKNIKSGRKIGIEPNMAAAKTIERNGVEHYQNTQQVKEKLGTEIADVIISTNVLEHTLNPLQEIINLRDLLKTGGRIHFIVPCDSVSYKYDPNDINHHLYSWSPQNLGNLFKEAGFKILYVRPLMHKWPPFRFFFSKLGWPIFNLLCKVFGLISKKWSQTEILAER